MGIGNLLFIHEQCMQVDCLFKVALHVILRMNSHSKCAND